MNEADRLLDAPEAAKLLTVSEGWLYPNVKKAALESKTGTQDAAVLVHRNPEKPWHAQNRLTEGGDKLYMMYTMTRQELRRVRKAMKLTQSQLAQRLGLTSTSVARMERGEQKIMPVTALAVKYLQVMESKTRGKKTSKVLEAYFNEARFGGSLFTIAGMRFVKARIVKAKRKRGSS